MTSSNPYHHFLNNNLATNFTDHRGESYADMVRLPILEGAVHSNPTDVEAKIELFELYFRTGRYKEASIMAKSINAVAEGSDWIVREMRCLILLGNFDEAEALNDANQPEGGKPLIGDWDAIQLMRDAIFSDYFLELEQQDYEQLFFLKPLLRKFGRHMKFVSYSLMDRFFFDLLALAKHYVDASGGRLHYVSCSNLYSIQNKSTTEIELLERVTEAMQGEKGKNRLTWLRSNPEHMRALHKELPHYNDEYLANICTSPKNMVQSVKLVMSEWESDYVNVRDGQRVTTGQPDTYDNKVMLFGASDVFAFGVEDKYTVASCLQDTLRCRDKGKQWRVENHGLSGGTLPFIVNNLLQTKVSEGDTVVLFGYPKIDATHAAEIGIDSFDIDFSRPHAYGEVFVDNTHFAWSGNKAISDILYENVISEFVGESSSAVAVSSLEAAESCIQFVKYLLYRRTYLSVEESQMQEYLDYLDSERVEVVGRIGSVAVNCNPMTKGHLHLLEHAARESDFLYVFVIEEDKSAFSFAERLEIVTKGLAHLPNVKVLKGGRYICTDITFPEYSTKEDKSQVVADASMEAWFFCEFIAKRLGISRIFLGREPKCEITRQYNDQMEVILPKFGIAVEIIERIGHDNQEISASLVRAYLAEKRFDLIREIVPDATYEHLVTNYR